MHLLSSPLTWSHVHLQYSKDHLLKPFQELVWVYCMGVILEMLSSSERLEYVPLPQSTRLRTSVLCGKAKSLICCKLVRNFWAFFGLAGTYVVYKL
jgi:hypothetical protein